MIDTVRGLKNALAYTREYRDRVFVVKLGGEILADAAATENVAMQLALLDSLSIRLVVVHGGGPQVTEVSRRLGLTPEIVAGRRVTPKDQLEVLKMVCGGALSLDLVAALLRQGLRAVGVRGADGGTVVARRRPPTEVRLDGGGTRLVDFGEVGDVERVDPSLIRALLDGNWVPVMAPIAAGSGGALLNVNADAMAEAVAVCLGADKLVFLTGVAGLLRDPRDPGSIIPFAEASGLQALLESGAVTGGMRPKLEACLRAVGRGVRRTHIVDGRAPDALLVEIFTGAGSGTMIVGRTEMAEYREHELV